MAKDRFSLLYLEPSEIYFEDFSVEYFYSEKTSSGLKGRLKVCSKSFVFVPCDLESPLLKFPLSDVVKVDEWTPISFRTPLTKKKHVIILESKSCVKMMENGVIGPFSFKHLSNFESKFYFSLEYGKVDDYLQQMSQLKRASTLTPVDQSSMIATIVFSRQKRSNFDSCLLQSVRETILFKAVGNKISPLVVNPGRIVLTNEVFYFQPYNNAESTSVIKIPISAIKRIFQRRYLLRPLGLEIQYVTPRGKKDHIYLTFALPEERQKMYHKLISQSSLKLDDISEDSVTLQWTNGVISNYEYLLYLNSCADRSFNDLTQYPIMPWVISDYSSSTLDLSSQESYRDLSKPIGALNPSRLKALKERASDLPEPKFLYGSHYSTPGFVLYYLVRENPEWMLCFQNGKFDEPDRMFNSIPQTWFNVTNNQSDFKELIPQFYDPEGKGIFLLNSKDINFGVRNDSKPVGDVDLPPWAKSPKDFVKKLNEALESDYVSSRLHLWIDLIFGYKQRGEEAEKADNLFYHLCYEGSVQLESIKDLEKRYSLETQIGEFGQVPKQIFTAPHPQKRSILEFLDDTEKSKPVKDRKFIVSDVKSSFWKSSTEGIVMVPLCDYKAHKEAITSVAISVDNLWVLSGSYDSILKMYSREEGDVLRSVHIGTMSVSSCIPLPNNKTVLIGSYDNNICSYSIELGRTSDFLSIHRDAISCMDWKSGFLATGSWDSCIKIWQCNEANNYKIRLEDLQGTLEHGSQVTSLQISPNNSQLVSGTRDGSVNLWCLRTFNFILELPGHSRKVNSAKFSPDGVRIVSCGSDFYMKIIDLDTGTILFSKDLGEELNCLAWDGQTVYLGGGSGYMSVWDVRTVALKTKVKAHGGPIKCLTVSNDGKYVVTGADDRRVVVWTPKALPS